MPWACCIISKVVRSELKRIFRWFTFASSIPDKCICDCIVFAVRLLDLRQYIPTWRNPVIWSTANIPLWYAHQHTSILADDFITSLDQAILTRLWSAINWHWICIVAALVTINQISGKVNVNITRYLFSLRILRLTLRGTIYYSPHAFTPTNTSLFLVLPENTRWPSYS